MDDWTPLAFMAGAVAGAAAHWALSRYDQELRRPRRAYMRVVHDRVVPAVTIIHYDAWNAHIEAFARACAKLERISERAVVQAGIVAGPVEYRIMADLMVKSGMWIKAGSNRKRRWADKPPSRGIARFKALRQADKVVPGLSPYPTGRPPAIGAASARRKVA